MTGIFSCGWLLDEAELTTTPIYPSILNVKMLPKITHTCVARFARAIPTIIDREDWDRQGETLVFYCCFLIYILRLFLIIMHS